MQITSSVQQMFMESPLGKQAAMHGQRRRVDLKGEEGGWRKLHF